MSYADPETVLLINEKVYEYREMVGIENRKIAMDDIVPLTERRELAQVELVSAG